MGLTRDIQTRRETQVRLGAGIAIAVLFASYCIVEFIQVDSVRSLVLFLA